MDDKSSQLPPPLPTRSPSIPPPLADLKSLEDTLTCANCGLVSENPEQAFCPACGQRTPAHRINWDFLGKELLLKILPADRGFINSLLRLLWRPGYFIRGYIHGQRVGYTKPQVMITMTSALLLLWSHHLLGSTPFVEPNTAIAGDNFIVALDAQITRWVNANFAAFNLLLLPMEALILRLVFGRMGGYNYPEWLVITAYLIAQNNILWTLMLPLNNSSQAAAILFITIIFGYNAFSLLQIFDEHSRLNVLLRAAVCFIMCIVAYLAMVFFVIMIAAILMASQQQAQP